MKETSKKPVSETNDHADYASNKHSSKDTLINPIWQILALAPHGPSISLQRKGCSSVDTSKRPLFQSKLRVGPVNDKYEQEADTVADAVISPSTQVHRQAGQANQLPVSVLQRKCYECEEHSLNGSPSGSDCNTSVSHKTRDLVLSPGPGRAIDNGIRRKIEPVLGADLSNVRVHTNNRAKRAAKNINAHAFTHKNHIFIGANASDQDLKLMAHEATHVAQQGAAHPLQRSTNGMELHHNSDVENHFVQRQPLENEQILQRDSNDFQVGDKCKVITKDGGNLMLRVQPTPAKTLDNKGPNTVGNIRSGSDAVIKEIRLYDWYVVEVATIEYGVRIGFINKQYLTSPPLMEPSGAQSSENNVAEPEIVPKQDEHAGSFDISDAEFEMMEQGAAVEKYGVVEMEEGTNLWPQANRTQAPLGVLPLNTKLFVERDVGNGWAEVYVEGHQLAGRSGAQTVPVKSGTHGFVSINRVSTDMPDEGAWLFRITTAGQGALAVAQEVYKDNFSASWGKDYRYLVNVLVAVNDAKGRRFLYKENSDDDWEDAKTSKQGQIWVPGLALVNALHGQLSSGSISYEVLSTLADIVIGTAGFIVGLLHGAVMSIADVFIGAYDLIMLAKDLVVKLVKQTLVSDAKAFYQEIKKIKVSDIIEMVGEKWNHPDTWTRWKFRGYVIGYAIVEILMLYFSAGLVTVVKWAGKAGKAGKLMSYLAKLPQIKKFTAAADALKGKDISKFKAAMKVANALSDAHAWAASVLRIPIHVLRRLTEFDISKLKRLPQWAQERFSRLKGEAMLRILGCHSPCKVDTHAIEDALRLATKVGTKLASPDDVIGALKKLDSKFKVAKISQKLRKSDSALMEVIRKAELTDTDFAKLADFLTPGDLTNQAQAYQTFVRYLTSVTPAKTGNDIKKFNQVMAAMIKAEPKRGAALKGAMFENWIGMHIAKLSTRSFKRITFNLRKLIGKTQPPFTRPVDLWVAAKGEIWEMKHTFGKVPDAQARDYVALIGKTAPDGNMVKSILYVFPTEDAAKLNRHLKDTYKFGVYYIDEATNTLKTLN